MLQVEPKRKPHVVNNSGNNEWFTPPDYTEAARRCMGGIDLDPASCEIANRIVRASRYYTIEDDGLTKEWYGRVWLNPPYSRDLVRKFSEKLVSSLPTIDQAIVLVNNATDTGWLQTMGRACNAVCFPNGRIKFLTPSGRRGSPLQGQVILYFDGAQRRRSEAGSSPERFREAFSEFGWIL